MMNDSDQVQRPFGRAWLTVAEVARCLNVSRSTVYRLAKAGRLTARKMGGRWGFDAQRLDESTWQSPAWLSGTAADVDEFLGFKPGTFDHIPHYAREEALEALLRVREMEENTVFRPGLYYTVLSDLCHATAASLALGNEISRKRVETFILTCVDALGHIETTNYHLFLREIGDAVLLLFSSFADAHEWWITMQSWLDGRDRMWATEGSLSAREHRAFRLKAKTVIHAGEVSYSGTNIPLSAAINQVFKVEKQFRPNELGITQHALACARPVLRSLALNPRLRCKVALPGDRQALGVYVVDNYDRRLRAWKKRCQRVTESRRKKTPNSED